MYVQYLEWQNHVCTIFRMAKPCILCITAEIATTIRKNIYIYVIRGCNIRMTNINSNHILVIFALNQRCLYLSTKI